MKKVLALALTVLSSSAAVAGEIAENATIGWQEAQCTAISRLDDSGFYGEAGDRLLALAKPRLVKYYSQLKANAIPKNEWGKIGGNLEAVAKISSNADRFVYALLAEYTKKLQNMRAGANYAPDNMDGQFYYAMAWVNGGCEAMLALDK